LNSYCDIRRIYRIKNEYIIEKILEISKSFYTLEDLKWHKNMIIKNKK
jgi:uncharacterized protein Smg (DUF494 family)